MEGVCQLCGKQAQLMQSHVLPSFVFKWLKQAGHIRHSQTPNRRSQDGIKKDWLCRECEDLFNSFETPFATRIFHPYDRDRAIEVRYGDWMLKFCTSVAWRTLLHLKQETEFAEFNARQTQLVGEALQTWSRFLRGEYRHTGIFEVHLLPFAEIANAGASKFPPNINRYLTRGVDIDAACNNSVCFTYSKLGPFAVFGFIELQYRRPWKGTKLLERNGWFRPREYRLPIEIGEYLSDRAMRSKMAMETISPTQQQKIADSIRANPDRFIRSGLFRAMQRDVEMFGSDAFAKYEQPTISEDD